MGRLLLIAAIVVMLVVVWRGDPGVRYPPGILVPGEPEQSGVSANAWMDGAYRIEPLARYDITARVLSTRSYWIGRDSRISPLDFAVAWGEMSDQAMIDRFSFDHGSRHLYYHARGAMPLPMAEVNAHVANMHLIPASDEIAARLDKVAGGQIVTLDGYLVQVKGPDGFFWRSSLTRTDSGDGACELMWVEQISTRTM